jgi:putative heme-binding domain-containing protein
VRADQFLPRDPTRPSASLVMLSQDLPDWIDLADRTATNVSESLPHRLAAIRVLQHVNSESVRIGLIRLLQPENGSEIQAAAAGALINLGERELIAKLFESWSQCPMATQRQIISAALRSPTATAVLVDALEAGKIPPTDLDPSAQQILRNLQNPGLAKRAKKLLQVDSAPSRNEVIKNYQPSLSMEGDRKRGATMFAKLCLPCHAIQGRGNHVGPELSGAASRPKEALLMDILDPSRQVTPDFISYTLTTTQGETVTGLIAAESTTSITLRRVGQADETISRNQIAGLRGEGKSLMPDGLELGLTQQDLADLLDFLTRPESQLLPQEK